MTIGRPTAYDPKFCKMLIEHMESGLSFESFAAVAHTCRKTIYNWCDSHEDFLHAKSEGQAKSQHFWEKGMRALAFGKLPGGNAATMLFTMKCRFGWREESEKTSDINVNLNYNLDLEDE